MSTLTYAALTSKREAPQAKGDATNAAPGVKTYVDALAALVPAEVLALHGLILAATTKTVNQVTQITAPGTLAWAFGGLIVLSMALYVAYRVLHKTWERLDLFRMLIPPLAFVAWTMLQRATAFDAVFPSMADATRTVIALFMAVILGVVAAFLAPKQA